MDRACGELIDHMEWIYGEQPTVVILSDHGMRPTHWIFHANAFLESAGYLRYARAGIRRVVAAHRRLLEGSGLVPVAGSPPAS